MVTAGTTHIIILYYIQKLPPIEEAEKTQRGRCRRWCSRTCIIIAVGVVLFLIAAALAGIIAAAVGDSKYIQPPMATILQLVTVRMYWYTHQVLYLVLCCVTALKDCQPDRGTWAKDTCVNCVGPFSTGAYCMTSYSMCLNRCSGRVGWTNCLTYCVVFQCR